MLQYVNICVPYTKPHIYKHSNAKKNNKALCDDDGRTDIIIILFVYIRSNRVLWCAVRTADREHRLWFGSVEGIEDCSSAVSCDAGIDLVREFHRFTHSLTTELNL